MAVGRVGDGVATGDDVGEGGVGGDLPADRDVVVADVADQAGPEGDGPLVGIAGRDTEGEPFVERG
jgi:hypothetical protein